jgi:hypothetical protein
MRRPENHFRSVESRFGLAVAYAHRCRKRIVIAAIMPKGTRMKSAIRMPIAMPLASGLRSGGTATSRLFDFYGFQSPAEARGGQPFLDATPFLTPFGPLFGRSACCKPGFRAEGDLLRSDSAGKNDPERGQHYLPDQVPTSAQFNTVRHAFLFRPDA